MSDKLDKNTVSKDDVIFDPSQYYETPEDIVQDHEILTTREDKIKALENWRLDLALRGVAVEENMRPLSKVNPKEIKLQDKIIAALAKLNENPTFSGTKFGSI